jgi:hydrogenase maturation protein HypF
MNAAALPQSAPAADALPQAEALPTATALAPSVAGQLPELGLMLPYTPLQHLLLAEVGFALVMTSGNISEEPILAGVDEAHQLLGSVADAFLDNDREILSRYDDSVVRVVNGETLFVRRARGYAPTPLLLPCAASEQPSAAILACGPEQKSSFCLARGNTAFVSQHIGDLENASTFATWLKTTDLYQRLFGLQPGLLVCDRHPEYLASKWARAQAGSLLEVQHHHAHIASVLAEHHYLDNCIGVAFDGTGYGEDGNIWGGEVLLASLTGYERLAHLQTVPLAGGRAAIAHPEQMAFSWLVSCGLAEHPGASNLRQRIGSERLPVLEQIINRRLNSPLTSSMGRLFDAVSALVGICTQPSYEGQPAVELEAALYGAAGAAADCSDNAGYKFAILDNIIQARPVLSAILDDLEAGASPALISGRFHQAVVEMIVEVCTLIRAQRGLAHVALSGGCFMNRFLSTHVPLALQAAGFQVLKNRELPANDGCIAYGQAAVAAAQLAQLEAAGIQFGN